jgi:hypothetical protein
MKLAIAKVVPAVMNSPSIGLFQSFFSSAAGSSPSLAMM